MPRLFVAYRPPSSLRDRLAALMHGVDGARWQGDEQLHLTLRFVGEVDGAVADDIAEAVLALRFAPIEARIEGVGSFARNRRLDSLWAAVQPRAPLAALHAKIDHAVIWLGLAPERRAFLPHITLARFGRSPGNADSFVAANAALKVGPFVVDHAALFESHLSAAGATYHEVVRVAAC